MKRSEVIEAVAQKLSDLPSRRVEDAVRSIINSIYLALCDKKQLQIRGFGTFYLSSRKGGRSRDPRDGRIVFVKKRHIPKFRASKQLTDKLD